MMQTIREFSFFQMRVLVNRSGLIASGVLLVICIAAAVLTTTLTPLDALIAGILAVILHWLNEIIHQYGHFLAAKRTGYPFERLRMWTVLSTPLYPKNEGTLTPAIHIRRASGGPIISAALTTVYLLLAWLFWNQGGMLRFLLGFALINNGLVLTLGALFPPIYLPFFANDGGTILHYWRQMKR
jgi:hypothetical protein